MERDVFQIYQNEIDNEQNYKSACNKIRDGLCKLNDNQVEIRAIWELVQNARDVAEETGALITIKLSTDKLVFSHHGIPFDYRSLRSLVKQDSSKDRENQNIVGQYGTGFMTTHVFNDVVHIKGPFAVKSSEDKISGYVQINDFILNRKNIGDSHQGPNDMADQLKNVSNLYHLKQTNEIIDDTTSFTYELTEEKAHKLSEKLDSVITMLPFVLTINNTIKQVEVIDNIKQKHLVYRTDISKEEIKDLSMSSKWRHHRTIIEEENKTANKKKEIICSSLQSISRHYIIIIPPFPETCSNLKKIPSLFLWFPLLGTENFGVNFIFHSQKFYPVETRDNIQLPCNSTFTEKQGKENQRIINGLTKILNAYYSSENNAKTLTREMCEISFPDTCEDKVTEEFYKKLREIWGSNLKEWKIIPLDADNRERLTNPHVKLLHDKFYKDLSTEDRQQSASIFRKFASCVIAPDLIAYQLPPAEELIPWSETVANWNCIQNNFFITVDDVCKRIAENNKPDDELPIFIEFLIKGNNQDMLDKYPMICNREGTLCLAKDLYSASFLNKNMFDLVKDLMDDDRNKLINEKYDNILYKFKPYTSNDLKKSINEKIQQLSSKTIPQNKQLDENEISSLVKFCSGYSKNIEDFNGIYRGALVQTIANFYDLKFELNYFPITMEVNGEESFYKSAFDFLIKYTFFFINSKANDTKWVENKIKWLNSFLDKFTESQEKDRVELLNIYNVIPNQQNELCKLSDLEINKDVPHEFNKIYIKVEKEDLRKKWINNDFINSIKIDDPEKKLKETDVNEIAEKLQIKIEEDMLDGGPQQYKEIVQQIITYCENTPEGNTNTENRWRSWFKRIFENKADYVYRMMNQDVRNNLYDILKFASSNNNQYIDEILKKVQQQLVYEEEKKAKLDRLKKIGEYIQDKLREKISQDLAVKYKDEKEKNTAVEDIQNGQDLIVFLGDTPVYYIEVKSKWNFDDAAHMSTNQIKQAVNNKDCYALCCVDLRELKREGKELVTLNEKEIINNTRVNINIGHIYEPLIREILEADKESDDKQIKIKEYRSYISAEIFKKGITFDEFISFLEEKLRDINNPKDKKQSS